MRRRVIRWFRLNRLLDAAAAADMLALENSGFSIDAIVRITPIDRDVPNYFQSLDHLLRYCACPPFALERLSAIRGAGGRITRGHYVLPRHRAANWVGPNHKLRRAVTTLAIGHVGKRGEAPHDRHAVGGPVAAGCCDPREKPRLHDASRITWAKLMVRVGKEFPMQCPGCGGDIRLIAFITEPGPIRKNLTHLGEPLKPPLVSPARGPPTDWGEVHDDRDAFQASPYELPVIDIHSL